MLTVGNYSFDAEGGCEGHRDVVNPQEGLHFQKDEIFKTQAVGMKHASWLKPKVRQPKRQFVTFLRMRRIRMMY